MNWHAEINHPFWDVLDAIPYPGQSTTKSYKLYRQAFGDVWYKLMKEHPCRNRPEAARWLIERYARGTGFIFDPMAGIGSTMFEACQLGFRGFTCGWDIRAAYRSLWPEGWAQDPREMERKHPAPVIDLVVTSPEYWGTCHAHGGNYDGSEKERKINSSQGREHKYQPDDWEEDVGAHASLEDHLGACVRAYSRILPWMQPGGHFVVTVRDRIVEKLPLRYPENIFLMLLTLGSGMLVPVGAHPRRIYPGHWWRSREKRRPGQLQVVIEWSLVFQVGGSRGGKRDGEQPADRPHNTDARACD